MFVDIARPIGASAIMLKLEQVGVARGEEATIGAEHPAREGGNGHPHQPRTVEKGVAALLGKRRNAETLYLRPELHLHRVEQSFLTNLSGVCGCPIVETHHHHREVREVNDRPNTKGVEQLARTNFANMA